jgi:hypothetical protein
MSSQSNVEFRRMVQPTGVDSTDFNDFLNSNVPKNSNLNPQTVNALKNGVYVDDPNHITDNNGNDVTDVYKAFLGFVDLKKKDAQARDEYLKAFQDMPGRNGTLTTGVTANQNRQILGNGYTGVTTGASANPNKSPILGG